LERKNQVGAFTAGQDNSGMKLHDLIDFGGLSSGVLALQTRNTTNIHDEFH